MIFYTKYKIDGLFCPRCQSALYRSTYFEHYPEYPYGCVKCDELIAETDASRLPPENMNSAKFETADE